MKGENKMVVSKTMTPRVIRKRAHLGQVDIANMVGVSVTTVSHWETGKTFPPRSKWKDIEKAYGVPFKDIEWAYE